MNAVLMSLLEGGWPNLAISFVSRFFTVMIHYYFMCRLLPHQISKSVLALLSSVYAIWFILSNHDLIGTSYHLAMNIFINAFTYFIITFLYQGKFWRKLIVWWYFEIIKTMCEAVAYVPILLYWSGHGIQSNWSWNAWSAWAAKSDALPRLIYVCVFLPLFLLFCFLSLTIWRRILMQKLHPFYLLFIILPMGMRYSLTGAYRPGMGDWFLGILINFVPDLQACYSILSLSGIFLGLASSIAVLYYVLSFERKAAIEAELRDTKRLMELEQARYSEMEQRSEELAKIRHDFNNQLASVAQLVRSGDRAAARELIASLSREIDRME